MNNPNYWKLLVLMITGLALTSALNTAPWVIDVLPPNGPGLWIFAYIQAAMLFFLAISASGYMLLATKHTGLWFGVWGFVSIIGMVLVSYSFAFETMRGAAETGCFVDDPEGMASSMYFSVVTLTTLGYGDIKPLGVCRVLAGTEALTGVIVLPMLVAFFVSAIDRMDKQNSTDTTKSG